MQIIVPDMTVEQARSAMRAAEAAIYMSNAEEDLKGAQLALSVMKAAEEAARSLERSK